MLKIIAIGKKHEDWVRAGVERYQNRLQSPFNTQWLLLPHSTMAGPVARNNESSAILHKLNEQDYVILLDERGKLVSSTELADQLNKLFTSSRNVVLVIGGAYGVSDELMQRADFTWALSPLVFPHQLVRLIVVEQIYRAQQISLGGPYHHA